MRQIFYAATALGRMMTGARALIGEPASRENRTKRVIPAEWQSFDPSGPIIPIPKFTAGTDRQIEFIRAGKLFVDVRGNMIDLTDVDWATNYHPFYSTQLHSFAGLGTLLAPLEKLPPDVEEAIASHIIDWARRALGDREINPRAWHEGTVMKRQSNLLHALNYTRRHGELSGLDEQILLYLIDANATFLLDEPGVYRRGNHGIRQDMMLAATAISLPKHPRAKEMIALAERRLKNAATAQFTDGGIWLEQAPGYVNYILHLMRGVVRLAHASPDFNPTRYLANFGASRRFLMDVLMPDGTIPPIGRSARRKVNPSVARPSTIKKHIARQSGLQSFLDYGLAVVRGDDDFYLLFVASRMAGKRHSDELSFLLYKHGRLWITEGGQLDTKRDAMGQYLVSPLAHNTYVLDGDFLGDREATRLVAKITDARQAGDGYLIAGTSNRFKRDAGFAREIRVTPNYRNVLVSDHLTGDGDWQGRLQIPGDLDVSIDGSTVSATDPATGRQMFLWFGTPISLSTCKGERTPLCGWGQNPDGFGPVTTLMWTVEENAEIEMGISWR